MSAPHVVIVDNYDSFTYNLFQYLAELGAKVDVFRHDQITVDGIRDLAPVEGQVVAHEGALMDHAVAEHEPAFQEIDVRVFDGYEHNGFGGSEDRERDPDPKTLIMYAFLREGII